MLLTLLAPRPIDVVVPDRRPWGGGRAPEYVEPEEIDLKPDILEIIKKARSRPEPVEVPQVVEQESPPLSELFTVPARAKPKPKSRKKTPVATLPADDILEIIEPDYSFEMLLLVSV